MDPLAVEINEYIRRWGNFMPSSLPPEDQLKREFERVVELLATDPPDYVAGPLTTARNRIGQARWMNIPQAVYGYAA